MLLKHRLLNLLKFLFQFCPIQCKILASNELGITLLIAKREHRWCSRMEGPDESTGLWELPLKYFDWNMSHRKIVPMKVF